MKRPEIIWWEVTTNEKGVRMATLPRDTMEQIVKYIEYADKQLRLGAVIESLPEHECKYCGAMTTQPDEECYRAPVNSGNVL